MLAAGFITLDVGLKVIGGNLDLRRDVTEQPHGEGFLRKPCPSRMA